MVFGTISSGSNPDRSTKKKKRVRKQSLFFSAYAVMQHILKIDAYTRGSTTQIFMRMDMASFFTDKGKSIMKHIKNRGFLFWKLFAVFSKF